MPKIVGVRKTSSGDERDPTIPNYPSVSLATHRSSKRSRRNFSLAKNSLSPSQSVSAGIICKSGTSMKVRIIALPPSSQFRSCESSVARARLKVTNSVKKIRRLHDQGSYERSVYGRIEGRRRIVQECVSRTTKRCEHVK